MFDFRNFIIFAEKFNVMKKHFIFIVLTVIFSACLQSQTVFSVEYESRADVKVFVVDYESRADLLVYKVDYESRATGNDGKWFFVDYESRAKKKIFFVDYESRADLKIFFVDYESRAGWRNKSKMHLMY
jgi:hypothetical protein